MSRTETDEDWAVLENEVMGVGSQVSVLLSRVKALRVRERELTQQRDALLRMTAELRQHPVSYQGPCWCAECRLLQEQVG